MHNFVYKPFFLKYVWKKLCVQLIAEILHLWYPVLLKIETVCRRGLFRIFSSYHPEILVFIRAEIYSNRNADECQHVLWDITASVNFINQFCQYVLHIHHFKRFYQYFPWPHTFPILLFFSVLITYNVSMSGSKFSNLW